MTTSRYRAAGVDLEAADRIKRRIGAVVQATRTSLVRGGFGGFGGMVALPADVERPVLVMSTDGVGTKVLVAQAAGRHDGIGEDLVNHCVNDILVHGARPLAFQDYLAAAALEDDVVLAIIEGLGRACRAHEMTLAGGETAQLPDLFGPGQYDLAGTIVGVVDERAIVHGDRVRPGDVVVGFAATGLHTNGYTLVRRIVFDEMRLGPHDRFPEHDASVADVLLAGHRSYASALRPVLALVHALAHVTGGGISGNLIRVLPEGCSAVVDPRAWPEPAVFGVLRGHGSVSEEEMRQVFNLGLGMLAVVPAEVVERVREAASRVGVESWAVGEVTAGPRMVRFA